MYGGISRTTLAPGLLPLHEGWVALPVLRSRRAWRSGLPFTWTCSDGCRVFYKLYHFLNNKKDGVDARARASERVSERAGERAGERHGSWGGGYGNVVGPGGGGDGGSATGGEVSERRLGGGAAWWEVAWWAKA